MYAPFYCHFKPNSTESLPAWSILGFCGEVHFGVALTSS